MFARIRATLAGPAGIQLVLPVLAIAWAVQRLADLADSLQADIEAKAARLAELDTALASYRPDDYTAAADRVAERIQDGYPTDRPDYPSADDLSPLGDPRDDAAATYLTDRPEG